MDIPEIRHMLGGNLRKADLASAAAVCKSWNRSFTPFLYSTIKSYAKKNPQLDTIRKYAKHIRTIALLKTYYCDDMPLELMINLEVFISIDPISAPMDWDQYLSLFSPSSRIRKIKIIPSIWSSPTIEFMTCLSTCQSLRCLEIHVEDLNEESTKLLFDTCMRLEELSIECVNMHGLDSLDQWKEFSAMGKLDLDIRKGFTTEHKLEFIRKCPRLESLSWPNASSRDLSELPKTFSIACPPIQNLSLGGVYSSDRDIAAIIDSCHNLKSLEVRGSAFGPVSFQSCSRYFATLTKLDFLKCKYVTSFMSQRILTSCPLLLYYRGSKLDVGDVVGIEEISVTGEEFEGVKVLASSRDWVCLNIKFLSINITGLKNTPIEWQRRILRQLARLEKLEHLAVREKYFNGDRDDGIDLKIESGLDILQSLKRLKRFEFDGLSQEMSEKEILWMMEAWPKLKGPIEWQRQVPRQLTRLEKLEQLAIGTCQFRILEGIDLQMEPGLDILKSLKRQERLDFMGQRQLLDSEAWQELEHVEGKLHPKGEWEILSIFTPRMFGVIMDQETVAKAILVGPRGGGKEAVANMLIQGTLVQRNRVVEKSVEDNQEENASLEVVDGRGWTVCVLNGTQSLKNNSSPEANAVKQHLKFTMREGTIYGFNMYCLVLPCEGLFDPKAIWHATSFRRLFPDAIDGFVLIVTDCDEEWIKANKVKLADNYADFLVVPVRFIFDEKRPFFHKAQRDKSLKDLEDSRYKLPKGAIVPNPFKKGLTKVRDAITTTKPSRQQEKEQKQQQQSLPLPLPPPTRENSQSAPTYNILVIGQSQSGKSTLTEAIRRYANPNCTINRSRIGEGLFACTKEVITESVYTRLAEYNVVNKNTMQPIDIKEYYDNSRKFKGPESDLGLTVKESSQDYHFQILDTPGLDDASGTDVSHIFNIVAAIRAIQEIHLVIIVVNSEAHLSEGLKEALRTYKNVFSTMRRIMIFLHTKVPNEYQPPYSTHIRPRDQDRRRVLDDIMVGMDIPHFMINNNLDESNPIYNCLNFNKISEILGKASTNKPFLTDDMPIHKTEKMTKIDRIVIQLYTGRVEELETTSLQMSKAYQLQESIERTQQAIERLRSYVQNHDTDRLEVIFENTFYSEKWKLFGSRKTAVYECPPQAHSIEFGELQSTSVEVLEKNGKAGQDTWKIKLKRKPFKAGACKMKLSTQQRNKFRREISTCKTQIILLENDLARLENEQRSIVERLPGEEPLSGMAFEQIMIRRAKYEQILDMIDSTTLTQRMYAELNQAGAYVGDELTCSSKVEKFYSELLPVPVPVPVSVN
ncbi:hypothetical protein BGZ49_009705 [Haplosporangium sp. Z 27]|nr:hypothetical protein BGZ49_009705 [Haplosporangium sp. Z 27]